MSQPVYETRIVPLALGYAQHLGLDVASLTRAAGVEGVEAVGTKKLITLPPAAAAALMDELAAASGDDHVGVSLALHTRRGSYGLAEFVVRSAGTVGAAFANTVRFSALLAPSQTFRFERGPREAVFEHVFGATPGGLGRHIDEYTTAITALTLFQLAPSVRLTRAFFASPPGPRPERLKEVLRTDVLEHGASASGYAVRPEDLELPVESSDSELHDFLEEQATLALAERPRADDLVERLRVAVREALAGGEPKVEPLAEKLGLSSRTLQRRLAELDTSFQQVLDDVRFDLARRYLRDERLDITEVAYVLGYSELRAFDRAFRRWAGMSPRQWRSGGTSAAVPSDDAGA